MSTKGTQWSDKGSIKTRFRLLSFLSIREEHSKQHKPKTGSKHENGHKNGLIANRWLDSCSLKEPGETSQSRYIMELVWSNGRWPMLNNHWKPWNLMVSWVKTIKRFDQLWTTTDPNGYLTRKPLKAMVTKSIATFQNFYHCSSL